MVSTPETSEFKDDSPRPFHVDVFLHALRKVIHVAGYCTCSRTAIAVRHLPGYFEFTRKSLRLEIGALL